MALVHETDNAGKTMELVDIDGYRLPTFWKTAEEIKGIFENIPNFSCDDDSLMLCSYPKTGKLRHHGIVLLRTFWSANAYLIASQQISTSTHFLPCLTPHKSQSLEN